MVTWNMIKTAIFNEHVFIILSCHMVQLFKSLGRGSKNQAHTYV